MNYEDSRQQVKNEFSKRFKLALKNLGVSENEQKRLGKLFGVSGQAVKKWIDGQAMPSTSRIPEIARILGVQCSWLQYGFDKQGMTSHETRAEYEVLSDDERKVIYKFRQLSSQQASAIETLIELFLRKNNL
ncbi:MAG: helix-turn-helix domain-containing protein [Methylococcales bacterium]|jgi:transcriptional regulator with XRE-family HTH domain|nr:helix-turn-helix domain-containing protein [Methylococcales bacterium]MBT7408145.1 helix-turn-helix domain-containing protein [Methylococcales bacterium]